MKKTTAASATVKQHEAAAPIVFAHSFSQASDSFNYENELEITADEMSDDLFAAVARGDAAEVARLTGGDSKFAGPGLLVAQAQKNRDAKEKAPDYADADLGKWQDAGMTQIMMYRTGGNARLAKLLLSQLQTNYLLGLDGVMADEMARDMGNHNLSEFLRQMQREEAARSNGTASLRERFNDRRDFLAGYAYLETAMQSRPDVKPVAVAKEEGKGFFQSCADCITGFFNSASSSKPMALEIVEVPTLGSAMRGLVQRFTPAF